MLYKELDLKKIRKECDLDFAHYTYLKGQCSCCYGPRDLPAKYWRNQKKPEFADYSYTYILFKNAHNGSGCVKANDVIGDYVCVAYRVKSKEQLDKICTMLQEQLGDDYIVENPGINDMKTIIIRKIENLVREYPAIKDGICVVEYGKGEYAIEKSFAPGVNPFNPVEFRKAVITARGSSKEQAEKIITLWLEYLKEAGWAGGFEL